MKDSEKLEKARPRFLIFCDEAYLAESRGCHDLALNLRRRADCVVEIEILEHKIEQRHAA